MSRSPTHAPSAGSGTVEAVLEEWWLPPELKPDRIFSLEQRTVHPLSDGLLLHRAVPSPGGLKRLTRALREQRQKVLHERSVQSILETLDRLARRWLSPDLPERRRCIAALEQIHGIPPETSTHRLDLMMRASRGSDLELALRRAVRDPRVLDRFTEDPLLGGQTLAVGPELVGVYFGDTLPALPHLALLRILLIKGACLGWLGRGCPSFLPLYLQTLHQEDPALASCVALIRSPLEDTTNAATLLAEVDHLVAYGSSHECSQLRQASQTVPPQTWHLPRLGVGVVLKSALRSPTELPPLARALAYDFTLLEQLSSHTPLALVVEEGGAVSPEALAEALSAACLELSVQLPPIRLSLAEQSRLRTELFLIELNQAMGGPRRLVSPRARLRGVVTLEPAVPLLAESADRFLRVLSVARWSDIPGVFQPLKGQLHHVVLAGEGFVADKLRHTLARLGCSRICLPGQMNAPSAIWQYDGLPTLRDLLHWCDEEVELAGETLEADDGAASPLRPPGGVDREQGAARASEQAPAKGGPPEVVEADTEIPDLSDLLMELEPPGPARVQRSSCRVSLAPLPPGAGEDELALDEITLDEITLDGVLLETIQRGAEGRDLPSLELPEELLVPPEAVLEASGERAAPASPAAARADLPGGVLEAAADLPTPERLEEVRVVWQVSPVVRSSAIPEAPRTLAAADPPAEEEVQVRTDSAPPT